MLNFRNSKVFLSLLIILAYFKNYPLITYGLELTIDLPPEAGKQPIVFYSPKNKIGEIQTKPTSFQKNLPNELDEKETIEKTSTKSSFKANSKESTLNNEIFPELSCLKENVDFWEKIYSDIDVNEGIIHDRNNLGRIYSIINLPKNEKLRLISTKRQKKLIENKILSLAEKIRTKNFLTPQEKEFANLFSKKELNYSELRHAAFNVRIQTGLKSQFLAGVRRSMNYMPTVYPIVKKSGLPVDLAYLPHVESSYNSRAGSKVGALGLWQLMPSTMRILEGKEAVYKRTDPSLSTKAAMKLLKLNYEKTGNWPLALTAYNHGSNGILRAINETKSRDLCKIIEYYDSPSFKFASSNFYAQFLAARKVAKAKYKYLVAGI